MYPTLAQACIAPCTSPTTSDKSQLQACLQVSAVKARSYAWFGSLLVIIFPSTVQETWKFLQEYLFNECQHRWDRSRRQAPPQPQPLKFLSGRIQWPCPFDDSSSWNSRPNEKGNSERQSKQAEGGGFTCWRQKCLCRWAGGGQCGCSLTLTPTSPKIPPASRPKLGFM